MFKPIKIANGDCRRYVQSKQQFTGSNMFGRWEHPTRCLITNIKSKSMHYVVYSYGNHFPIYVFTEGRWYENTENYSRTTGRHKSQAHPHPEEGTIKVNLDFMLVLSNYGLAVVNARRLGVVYNADRTADEAVPY